MNKQANKKYISEAYPSANGSLTLNLGWRGAWAKFTVVGGPFAGYKRGKNTFGLNLRAEAHAPCEAYLPIEDFSVPTQAPDHVAGTLGLVGEAALAGKAVYIGCMGGWGRTGLVLALLAKAAGVARPTEYVRAHYASHAVETKDQALYVSNFDVAAVRRDLFRAGRRAQLRKILPF